MRKRLLVFPTFFGSHFWCVTGALKRTTLRFVHPSRATSDETRPRYIRALAFVTTAMPLHAEPIPVFPKKYRSSFPTRSTNPLPPTPCRSCKGRSNQQEDLSSSRCTQSDILDRSQPHKPCMSLVQTCARWSLRLLLRAR